MDSLNLSKDGFLIIELEKIKACTFVLENIFFESNKSELKTSSIVELKKVLKLLQINPELKIEISGHTDSDGDDELNLSPRWDLDKTILETVKWYKEVNNGKSSYKCISENIDSFLLGK